MEDKFNESDRQYISLLQENINRMAGNSASCKTWLLTLIAAILALQISSSELRNVLWVALGLILLFYMLDSYYLSLERKFIALEKQFIASAKNKKEVNSLTDGVYSFDIKSVTDEYATFWKAMKSYSTLPFYLVLFIIVLIICLWPFFIQLIHNCCGQ